MGPFESMQVVAIIMGSSWGSGINLYLTVAGLGIAHRAGWLMLPGAMEAFSHPLVIAAAIFLYIVEFLADKVPYIDSLWDSVHTFIRPFGGLVLGYLAMNDAPAMVQYPVALLCMAVALQAHLTKATSRAAINTSPEPVTNSVASVTEDVAVGGMLYLMIAHPVIAFICVIAFILFSFWFLKKMARFMKKIFRPTKPSEADSSPPIESSEASTSLPSENSEKN